MLSLALMILSIHCQHLQTEMQSSAVLVFDNYSESVQLERDAICLCTNPQMISIVLGKSLSRKMNGLDMFVYLAVISRYFVNSIQSHVIVLFL